MTHNSILARNPVVFCGAGISLDPPAGLPDWNSLRDYTIEAIGSRDPFLATHIGELTSVELLSAPGQRGMTPEIVASVIAGSCSGYFECFRGLNEGTPNLNHALLARATKEGLIRYIVTTNFDLFLDEALRREDVPARLYRTEREFETFEADGGVHLLKLHGCISLPQSITSTVEAQGKGLSAAKIRALDALLVKFPFVFWGYSGADLKIDLDYLRMLTARERAPGFVWNLHQHGTFRESPNPYLSRLQAAYGERGTIVHGLLPAALRDALGSGAAGEFQPRPDIDPAKWRADKNEALRASLRRWAQAHVPPILALSIFGHLHGHNGQLTQALACFREMSQRAERDRDNVLLASALGGMARSYRGLGENRHAQRAYQRMLELSKASSDAEQQRFALNGLGGIYRAWGELDRAIEAYRGVERLAETRPERGVVALLLSMGEVYGNQGDQERALKKFEEAEAMARANGWKDVLAGILHNIGNVYKHWGEHEQAERYFREELELAKALGDKRQLGYCLRELAAVHMSRKEFADAEALLARAAQIAHEQADKPLEATVCSDQGALRAFHGKYEEARALYQRSMELHRETGEKRNLGIAYGTLATIWSQSGNIENAEDCHRRAVDLLESVGDRFFAAFACERLGEFLKRHKGAREALPWFKKSLSHYLAGGLNQYAKPALANIAQCRAAIPGEHQAPLIELLSTAMQRSKVAHALAEKIARRCGWTATPFDLARYCSAQEREHGREFAAYLYTIETKHQSIEFKDAGKLVDSLVCSALGFDISAQIDNTYGVSIFLNDMGYLYEKLGHNEKALEYLGHAIAAERQIGGAKELFVRLQNLGDIHFRLERFEEAEAAFREAAQVIRGIDDPDSLAAALLRLGDALKLQKKKEALAVYAEAEPLISALGEPASLSALAMGQGKAFLDQGNYEESIRHRSRARDLLLERGDAEAASTMAFLVGNTYDRYLNRPVEALPHFEMAIALAQRAGKPELASQYRAALADLRKRRA